MIRKILISLCLGILGCAAAFAEMPEHYYNPPENLNPDPNYTPGAYVLPDTYAAQSAYQLKLAEMMQTYPASDAANLFTIGTGEIAVSVLKNETKPVLGYFKNFLGVLKVGAAGPELMQLMISVNSYDSGVPGRNNRILAIFFESMTPEFATAVIRFDQFDLGGKTFEEIKDGAVHPIEASGTLTLNGAVVNLKAALDVQFQSSTWTVRSNAPVVLAISDFSFGNRIYDLLKECNHQSIGNKVEVKVDLNLR